MTDHICEYCVRRDDYCEPGARKGGAILWCSRFKRRHATPTAPQREGWQSSESIDTREK
jgi:hypothetical protein